MVRARWLCGKWPNLNKNGNFRSRELRKIVDLGRFLRCVWAAQVAVFHRETPRVSRVKRSVDQIEMGRDYSSIALRKSSSEGRTLRTSSADL